MTSERLKRVTSKIEAAVGRLAQLEPERRAHGGAAPPDSGDPLEDHLREIEDRDRKIAKLRADIDDISDLKDEEIARLRTELAGRAAPSAGAVASETHAALKRRHDALRKAAEAVQQRLDALIGRLEEKDG